MAEFGLSQRRKLNLPIEKIAKLFPTRKSLNDFFIISPTLAEKGFWDALEQLFSIYLSKNWMTYLIALTNSSEIRTTIRIPPTGLH